MDNNLETIFDIEAKIPTLPTEEPEELELEGQEGGEGDPTPEPPATDNKEDDTDPLFKYLVDNGLVDVPEDFEYDGTDDSLAQALAITEENRYERAKNDLLNALPEDFKPLLEYGLSGGNSLKDYLNVYAPDDIESLDVSDPADQETIIRLYYKENSKHSDERINRMIASFRDSGSLADVAAESLQDILEFRNQRKQEFVQRQVQEANAQKELIQERARKFNEAFTSYKTAPARKNQIQTLFSATPGQQSNFNVKLDSVLQNPTHLLQLAELMLDYDPTTGFKLERIQQQVASTKTKGLRDIIEQKQSAAKPPMRGSLSNKNDVNDTDFLAKFNNSF